MAKLDIDKDEKQEIVAYLEAGRPLPEKYRFLLFGDKREVELVWNSKSIEVCDIVLPFQTIEHVDEPRTEKFQGGGGAELQGALFGTDTRGRQIKGWTNKLIWGDNKLILSSLNNGPMRKEIEKQGGLKLIYIDPPFDVGADFSMDIEIGDDTLTKEPGILEEIAYRDTWGKGADSFIAMIYERLKLMRDLLAEDGSIYVHCDWRVNSYIRLAMDEIFGKENYINECIWYYKTGGMPERLGFGRKHDTIHLYSKQRASTIWNQQKEKSYLSHNYGFSNIELFKDEKGTYSLVNVRDVWDIAGLRGNQPERVNYPTQKPESLLERIIKASSNEGDLVADFFCGSGTTAAVAEKLGRRWIASDLGKFAIHTTRKRMLGVQRQIKADGENYRAFEILNLGKYERQHYIGVNLNLNEEQQEKQLQAKKSAFLDLILNTYRAEKVENFPAFHGKRNDRLVVIGPINLPVTRLFIEEIILECNKNHFTKVDILGFQFEMGLSSNIVEEANKKSVDIALKYIPAEVFDKRAVEKNQVVFHDVSYVRVKPHITKGKKGKPATLSIELTDYSAFYSQDSIAQAEESLASRRMGNKIIIENGRIIKVVKDQSGIITHEVLTKNWQDWIDYWSVDFDFESKLEIIQIWNSETKEWKVQPTGDYIFENEWQSFRTKKDRTLEMRSIAYECKPGIRKVAVKVVDIFGNDTMTVLKVDPYKK